VIKYAPGKLMIAGEYSVLWGGKSIVAACNNYQAEARYEACNKWAFFARTSGSFVSHAEHKLFLATKEAARRLGVMPKLGAYYLDTHAFYNPHTKNKIGLGSSAAGVTALSKLFLAQNGIEDHATLHTLASLAHRNFSKSIGSGADIAASVYETLIEFHNVGPNPHINPVILPWWQEFIWIDTLRPQNTRTFVSKALDTAQKEKKIITQFIEQSNYFCAMLLNAKSAQETVLPVSSVYKLLQNLSEISKLDIISTEHQKIHELALSLGGSAKPSGAGGGDLSIAWVPMCSRENFLSGIGRLGFLVLYAKKNLEHATRDARDRAQEKSLMAPKIG